MYARKIALFILNQAYKLGLPKPQYKILCTLAAKLAPDY